MLFRTYGAVNRQFAFQRYVAESRIKGDIIGNNTFRFTVFRRNFRFDVRNGFVFDSGVAVSYGFGVRSGFVDRSFVFNNGFNVGNCFAVEDGLIDRSFVFNNGFNVGNCFAVEDGLIDRSFVFNNGFVDSSFVFGSSVAVGDGFGVRCGFGDRRSFFVGNGCVFKVGQNIRAVFLLSESFGFADAESFGINSLSDDFERHQADSHYNCDKKCQYSVDS